MPALTQGGIQQIMEDRSEDARELGSEQHQISKSCPVVAVPEKIVLCIDVSQDYSFKPYTLKDDSGCNPFLLLKKVVTSFVNNKQSFNNEHEFAVMSVEPGGVKWVHDFSSDPKKIVNAVNSLELICLTEPQEVDLTPVFKEVSEHVGNLPQVSVNAIEFPENVVRLILVYNSSYNIPKINNSDETFVSLTSSKYFHLDVLYLHDAPSSENKCQDVYNVLINVCPPSSYIFESSRKVVKVFNSMAKLLAHPLQRYEEPLGE